MKSHPMSIGTVYELYDRKDGELIYTSEKTRSGNAELIVKINNPGQPEKVMRFPFRSYVSNFARLLNCGFLDVDNSTGGVTINKVKTTTTGGAGVLASQTHKMKVNEGALTGAAQTEYGIWIGDMDNLSGLGLTVEAPIGGVIEYDNYSLRTLMLADGGSPDTNVTYYGTNVVFINSDTTLAVGRRFQNNGTVDLKISEMGLVATDGSSFYLLARDLVTQLVPLPFDPSGQLTTMQPYYPLLIGGTIEVSYVFSINDASGLTQNYLKMLSSLFVEGNAISQVRDINNTAQTIDFSSARTQMDLLAAATNDLFGIQIGRYLGSDTIGTQNYNTSGKIIHGSTIDTLDYGAVIPIALEQSLNKTSFGLYRDFENKYASGSIITNISRLIIKETGTPTYYLIGHDFYGGTQDANSATRGNLVIAPNQVLRVKYIFEAPL